MNNSVKAVFLIAFILSLKTLSAQDTTQKIVPGRVNSIEQQKKPYVILISADGFRYDLADKFQATHLLQLRSRGITAEYMQPSFPSLTFPNHYSIITGLYPSHHGIVDNNFYDKKRNEFYNLGNKKAVADSSWYGGTPLWVLAEKNKMLSASFYWVASESAIQGVRPTYYYNYNEAIPIDKRIEIVKNWLQLPENIRPHFITFYFPQVDHEEHHHGVGSKEAIEAIHLVDNGIGQLVSTIDSLNLQVNFIFVADHGMMNIDTVATLPLPAAVDTTKFLVPVYGLSLLHLYAKDSTAIQPTYEALKKENAKDYDVNLAKDMPARWHYNTTEDKYDRIGDILLVPHKGKVFNIAHRHMPAAEHGYDPAFEEMHATFYAWGPAFKSGEKIKGFENINVFPLIAYILGLDYTDKIDGDLKVLKPILKK